MSNGSLQKTRFSQREEGGNEPDSMVPSPQISNKA
jgi:hypothetical protein